jgi:hypothetical protein
MARKKVFASARVLGPLVAVLAVCLYARVPPAGAIPPPEAPRGRPSPGSTAAPTPAGPILPYGSAIFFVLDDKIDSGKTPVGTVIHLHLQSPLSVGGVTLAPAGTPGTLTLISRLKANMGNEDGAVQLHIDPLALAGRGRTLPLRLLHEYLTIERTGGQQATSDTVDTIGDIFIPYHLLYHYMRPGHQFVLPPGALVRATTEMTIDASDPKTIVFSTPPPFESTYDTPHSDLTPQPLYTPAPDRPHPLRKGKPTLPPSPPPSITPDASTTRSTSNL